MSLDAKGMQELNNRRRASMSRCFLETFSSLALYCNRSSNMHDSHANSFIILRTPRAVKV